MAQAATGVPRLPVGADRVVAQQAPAAATAVREAERPVRAGPLLEPGAVQVVTVALQRVPVVTVAREQVPAVAPEGMRGAPVAVEKEALAALREARGPVDPAARPAPVGSWERAVSGEEGALAGRPAVVPPVLSAARSNGATTGMAVAARAINQACARREM